MFRNYTLIRVGIKNQSYCITNYYKERLIMKVFAGLKQYVQNKKEYRINALVFKHRGWQRKLIYMWKVAISKKIIKLQPDNKIFYYASY